MFRGKTEPGPRAYASWAQALPRRRSTHLLRGGFALFAAAADFAAIAICAYLAHLALNGAPFSLPPGTYARLGLLTATFFVSVAAIRGDYGVMKYLTFDRLLQRAIIPWAVAILCTLMLLVSRRPLSNANTLALFILFAGGFIAVNAVRLLITIHTRARARQGGVAAHRIFLLGHEKEIEAFTKRFEPWIYGVHIVAAAVLRGSDSP